MLSSVKWRVRGLVAAVVLVVVGLLVPAAPVAVAAPTEVLSVEQLPTPEAADQQFCRGTFLEAEVTTTDGFQSALDSLLAQAEGQERVALFFNGFGLVRVPSVLIVPANVSCVAIRAQDMMRGLTLVFEGGVVQYNTTIVLIGAQLTGNVYFEATVNAPSNLVWVDAISGDATLEFAENTSLLVTDANKETDLSDFSFEFVGTLSGEATVTMPPLDEPLPIEHRPQPATVTMLSGQAWSPECRRDAFADLYTVADAFSVLREEVAECDAQHPLPSDWEQMFLPVMRASGVASAVSK